MARDSKKLDPAAAALLLFLACFDDHDSWYKLSKKQPIIL
jgi:hypothetical protein